MKFIFLIAAFNAFFFAILLFQKKPRALHDNILILWLLYLGLFIGVYSFYSHELFTHFKLLSISFTSLFLLHGVFLFFYIYALIASKKIFNKINLIHFVPFTLFNGYLLIISFFPDISERIRLDYVQMPDSPPLLFFFFLMITLLSGPIYFVISIKLFEKLDIDIFNNFSSSEEMDLVWLRKLVYVFGIIWTALIVITVIHHVFNLFSMVFCTDGLFLSLSVFVILIGYFGLKQKVIFSGDAENEQIFVEETKVKYAGSRLTEAEANQFVDKLNNFMVTEKPYLNPNLTLQELASELEISTHYLSQIINEKFNLNFFDYINQFRVEEFKVKISDPKFENYSFLGIAFDCGFNSKSAFNRIFKKFTNLTPSQYKTAVTKP
ncbi:MAG: AraC family transcriptional regulator [Lutibacter sp.]|jgi:AraC-like DNA-binding protein|uniref:helix-turn-helix domain-containing protein n=1 Tax=Lutibacter sp. TaxID=1925666 RepID=UPI00299D3188|nr:AraC family transcriptional regulator [Lutibacter sp.]MDX1829225.1 AraC family transcriptional regulator [Lutibacter sp.]